MSALIILFHVASYSRLSPSWVVENSPACRGFLLISQPPPLRDFSSVRFFSALVLAHDALSVISKLNRFSPSVASLVFSIVSLALA
jgi:hypothetical protein